MAALVNDSTGLESLPQFIDCDIRERERVSSGERGGGRRGERDVNIWGLRSEWN